MPKIRRHFLPTEVQLRGPDEVFGTHTFGRSSIQVPVGASPAANAAQAIVAIQYEVAPPLAQRFSAPWSHLLEAELA